MGLGFRGSGFRVGCVSRVHGLELGSVVSEKAEAL